MRERLRRSILFCRDYLTYWRYYLTDRQTLDFVSMGLGIQARYRCHQSDWNPHLEKTKVFIAEALGKSNKSEKIAVLGAGHLLDFPLKELVSSNHRIDLYDYNPSLCAVWKNLRSAHPCIKELYCCDVTGVLEVWSRELQTLGQRVSTQEIAEKLIDIPRRFPPHFELRDYTFVISLNILSQLGLYWQDRVLAFLFKRGILASLDDVIPKEIESAIAVATAALESSHLKMLELSGAKQTLIICDTEYRYYRSDVKEVENIPALEVAQVQLENQALEERSEWEWHIARQGAEGRDYGEIHQVTALRFLQRL